MKDYALPKYDDCRKWIRKAREKGFPWEKIFLANKSNDEELREFLRHKMEDDFWEVDAEDWKTIVSLQKDEEEKEEELDATGSQAIIYNEDRNNDCTVPSDPYSSWMLYKKKLKSNGLTDESIKEIEKATIKILKRLSRDTTQSDPVRGLVVGNVQSGKTANMAALMAMAADWGWNFFIILSGTIDNLRLQTQDRLFGDLNEKGNLNWRALQHLSKKTEIGQQPQHLHFGTGDRDRYFTVCLKNSSRLMKLIQWLQYDVNKQKQMKILVIDDEADQAGINTADISEEERRKINRLICNLVNGKTESSKEAKVKYQAMNYVGYTATPYANILNEAALESLYPRNFISTLKISNEYFGPQQIFGLTNYEYEKDGLNIIRTISEKGLLAIQNVYEGAILNGLPIEFENALCWFICGVACLRVWNYKKPISMLVHTSQKTEHHEKIAEAIKCWFEKDKKELIHKCKLIWEEETKKFTLNDFKNQYSDYGLLSSIKDYPKFSDIQKDVELLLHHNLTNIPLDNESEELKYHEGIHLCIDNCKNSFIKDDNDSTMFVRLAYPSKEKMPSPAPAFIVVGGATLSRGLTIEGLISTFFLRSSKQADSLMQMGRWFGYRKGYELIPRIWLTDNTKKQFEFLSVLDQELRDEIKDMEIRGIRPSEYGPKVKNSPKLSFLRITAKNKMQEASAAEMDFSGSYSQTYLFDNNQNILEQNLKETEAFISSLNAPEPQKRINIHANGSYIWRDVDFSLISNYLKKYNFQKRQEVFNDIDALREWIDKLTKKDRLKKWNIILVGRTHNDTSPTNIWQSPAGPLIPVTRTKKKRTIDDGIIDIGVLRDPSDIVKDIDLENQTDDVKKGIKNFKSRFAKEIRRKAKMDNIPQLLIYVIDKDSKVRKSSQKTDNPSRLNLEAPCNIVGICLNIPETIGEPGANNVAKISIDMSKYKNLEDVYAN